MSKIYLNPDCKTKIHIFDGKNLIKNSGISIIENDGFIVIDNYHWNFNQKLIQKSFENKCRSFDEKFKTEVISENVAIELQIIKQQIIELTEFLFSKYSLIACIKTKSYRPMITGPEWMHFDTKLIDKLLLTSYLNLDSLPRIYKISHTFSYLIHNNYKKIKKLNKLNESVAVAIREETIRNTGLINNLTPKHLILLDYGTIWFFNPHIISHEIIFGRGAMGQGNFVSNSKVKSQKQLLEEIK